MKKYIVKMRAKVFDVEAKKMVCILNEADAKELGVFALDRIHASNPKTKNFIHSVVDTTDSFVKKKQIGMFNDIARLLNIKNGSTVLVSGESKPKSISFIRDKIDGKALSQEQLMEIVSDMKSNKLSDVEATAFVTAVYINGFNLPETVAMTKALVKGGKKISFATHDLFLIDFIARKFAADRDKFEFNLLMGIEENLCRENCLRGFAFRRYITCGINWRPYGKRRAEAVLGIWLRNFFYRTGRKQG